MRIFRLPPEHRALAFLTPDIARIRKLEIFERKCRDISVIEDAVSLETLDIGELKPQGVFDASRLRRLRSLQAKSSSTILPLLGLPTVEKLWLTNAQQDDLAGARGRIRRLRLENFQARELPASLDLSRLTDLQVVGAQDLDVSGLARAPWLRNVRFQNVKVLRGLGAIRNARGIGMVELINVESVESFDGFDALRRWQIDILGNNPFPPEFLHSLSPMRRLWWRRT